MNLNITGQQMKEIILNVIDEYSQIPRSNLEVGSILKEAAKRLNIGTNKEVEQALLTIFYDIFLSGQISWGKDLTNFMLPFCHLTEKGRQTLENISRDPANPDGYIAHLNKNCSLNPVAESYIKEALKTFNSNCVKATSVMIGAAAESLVLDLRDTLVNKIRSQSKTPPRNLQDWRIKRVLDAIKGELEIQKNNMPTKLQEDFSYFWTAFVHQIRSARNEAGHPINVDPVTPETVYASLLIFPELAKLVSELKPWVSHYYT